MNDYQLDSGDIVVDQQLLDVEDDQLERIFSLHAILETCMDHAAMLGKGEISILLTLVLEQV